MAFWWGLYPTENIRAPSVVGVPQGARKKCRLSPNRRTTMMLVQEFVLCCRESLYLTSESSLSIEQIPKLHTYLCIAEVTFVDSLKVYNLFFVYKYVKKVLLKVFNLRAWGRCKRW